MADFLIGLIAGLTIGSCAMYEYMSRKYKPQRGKDGKFVKKTNE